MKKQQTNKNTKSDHSMMTEDSSEDNCNSAEESNQDNVDDGSNSSKTQISSEYSVTEGLASHPRLRKHNIYDKWKANHQNKSNSRLLESTRPASCEGLAVHQIIKQKIDGITDGTSSQVITVLFYAIVAIVTIVACFLVFMFVTTLNNGEPVENIPETFERSFAKVKSNFPNQRSITWKVLAAAFKVVASVKRVKQPSVVTIAALEHTEDILDCFLKKILKSLMIPFDTDLEHISINGSQLQNLKADDAKRKIYNVLNEGFSNYSHVAVIDYFEKIPAEAAQILHTFCDHENAPFKDVVIMLVIREKLPKSNTDGELNADKMVGDFLQNIWKDVIDVDSSYSLLSRIANRVVIFDQEEDKTLRSIC